MALPIPAFFQIFREPVTPSVVKEVQLGHQVVVLTSDVRTTRPQMPPTNGFRTLYSLYQLSDTVSFLRSGFCQDILHIGQATPTHCRKDSWGMFSLA